MAPERGVDSGAVALAAATDMAGAANNRLP
jgi:hypothetical protein